MTPTAPPMWRGAASGWPPGCRSSPGRWNCWTPSPRLPLAIATAATRAHAEEHLARTGLRPRFGVVLTREDVAHSKPRPDLFLRAAEGLGVGAADCLAVEDSHNGVRAAHAAGMMTVMVPDIVPADAEIGALCVAVADDLHAVRRLLAAADVAAM